ncbi:hypothetical protein [Azotobacter chroococcum]|uniref:hypothetical protein n=1 Tax=Azotobacter chroococcum TaxID=353 RepID=UPI0010AE27F4|nr:hypothetical protein [Azotobacter chroococcum]TKD35298.1 hypothetical protein FCG41_17820 [Azotobacter chroococcum]
MQNSHPYNLDNDRFGSLPVTSGEFDPVAKHWDDSLFSLPRLLSAELDLLRMKLEPNRKTKSR